MAGCYGYSCSRMLRGDVYSSKTGANRVALSIFNAKPSANAKLYRRSELLSASSSGSRTIVNHNTWQNQRNRFPAEQHANQAQKGQ